MNDSRSDRWSSLESPQAVADAVQRLRQMTSTRSEQQAMARWLDILAPQPGQSLVDVGAGIGDMSMAFARQVAPDGTVHALDLAPGLLDCAGQRAREEGVAERVRLHVGDARDLPFRDDGLDHAFCRWVLLHLPDPERAVAEMRRVVMPGGRILCVEVDWATLHVEPGDPEITQQIVKANVDRQVDGRSGRKLPALLRSAGLERLSIVPVTARDHQGDWLSFLESRLEVAIEAGVPEKALFRWWQSIQTAAGQGTFHLSFTQYGVTGMVPPLTGTRP
ncbi:MAG: methyltransferase domain-containing protein [Ectothiorhodospiraceae bacterium]|nr:methyltransferase domain-containing protein [Ectothiorhodospiraceae bacterium]